MSKDLFEHIRNSYKNPDAEGAWNDPPDFIFDEAIKVVQEKQIKDDNKERRILPLWLILVGLISTSFLAYNFINKINGATKDSLESNSNTIVVSELQQNTYTNSNNTQTENSLSNRLDNIRQPNSTIDKGGIDALKSNTTFYSSGSRNTSSANNEIVKNSAFSIIPRVENELTISNASSISPIYNNLELAPLSHLEGLLKRVETSEKQFILDLAPTVSLDEAKRHKNRGHHLFLGVGQGLAFIDMQASIPAGISLTEYEKLYKSSSYEIGLISDLSQNLFSQVNIGYKRIFNSSLYQDQGQLTAENIQMDGMGNASYQVDPMMTPLGTIASAGMVDLRSTDIDPAKTEQIATFDQQLRIFNISAGLGYRILDQEKFGIDLIGAVNFNRVTKIVTESTYKLMDMRTNEIVGETQFSDLKLSGYNKSYVGYNLGSRFNWNFDNNAAVSLGVYYDSSFGNLLSPDLTATSKFVNFNFQMGLTRRF